MANSKSKLSSKTIILVSIIAALLIINIILLVSRIELTSEVPNFVSFDNSTSISMILPAVDENDTGSLTYLTVEATPGTGRILVDIDNLLFWEDTQQSMRTARNVAADITGKDINDYDLIYNVHANANIIGGPSAGAALAIATIAALESRQLNSSVMITGSINHDGTIGPAGGIVGKAAVAKDSGAKLFLVPLLQARDVVYEETEYCEKFGWTDICTTEQIPVKIDVQKETGIRVIEVGSIEEALKYF